MTNSPTATLGRFAWYELLTSDPIAAQKFYKEVIGWTTSQWGDGPAAYTMWMSGETPVGGVMQLPEKAAAMGAPPHWLAYNEVPDVDRTVADAEKLGAKVLVPAQTVDEVGRFAILQDPQGAVFAVITNQNPLPEETEPQPREFSWHELVADDSVALIDFYQKLFKWEKKAEHDMGQMGVYRMYGRDRFTYLGAMDKPGDAQMPTHWLHYIRVADTADAAVARATAAGATLIHGPMEVPGGDRVAILVDPQGAGFAVHSKK